MIKIYLQNLAKVINGYYSGNKEFDAALDNNERLLLKLSGAKLLGGNIEELKTSVQKLIQVNTVQEEMINRALGNNGTEYKTVKLFGDINSSLAVGQRLVEYLGILNNMVDDKKLSQMIAQLAAINNILDEQLA